jgi:hypothetical protein
MVGMIRQSALSLLSLCLAILPAFSQTKLAAISASARLEKSEIQLGQPVAVVVEVKGCDSKPEIKAPTSADCSITLAGKLAQPSMVAGLGGKGKMPGLNDKAAGASLAESLRLMTGILDKDATLDPDLKKQLESTLGRLNRDDFAFVYHVHANRTGTIEIPPFTVTANGQKATTSPLELHVEPTKSQDYVRLAMSLSTPQPLVGQEVRLNLDVLIRREQVSYNNKTYPHLPVKNVHLTLPALDGAKMELVTPLEDVLKARAPQQGHHGYKLNHLPYEAVFEMEPAGVKEEKGWYRRRLEVPMRFKEAGRITVPSAGVAGEVWVNSVSPGRRSNGRWQSFVAVSSPLNIEIRNLPANRPRDFRGNIGPLRVTTTADQTRMPVGTPFKLTVRLEGQGYQPAPGSVDLAANPDFATHFRILPDNDRALSDTLREATYTLRPLDAKVKEVPPVAVSYFDSQADQFRTVRSQAIPLEVTPGANLADSLTKTPPESPSEPSKDELPPLEDLAVVHQKGWLHRNLLAMGALLLAGMVVAGVLAGGRIRQTFSRLRTNQATKSLLRQHQQTLGEVHRKLASQPGSPHEVRELVQRMLRQRFGMPPGEITAHDAAERLRQAGVAESVARSCEELMEQCAAAEFAPGMQPVPLPELAARAEGLVRHIAG